MNSTSKGLIALAVGLTGLSASSHAQTVSFNALGSSAIFLEVGEGATLTGASYPGAVCVWSGPGAKAIDSVAPSTPDSGNAFVAYTKTGSDCTTSVASSKIYAYVSTDSVVGNRCLFDGTCKITYAGATGSNTGLISTSTSIQVTTLPAAIIAALDGGAGGTGLAPTAAGTDIRPEDAEFATTRVTTACGTPVVAGSQYLGLGYTSPSLIDSYFSAASFNVISFTLPSAFTATPVGATPIVVVVNGPGSGNGFSDNNITNLPSGVLANYLDGTYSRTQDALLAADSATSAGVNVIIREPLSGTYNTMEYNVPNSQALKTSQDVGVNQHTAQKNCNSAGTAPESNPMNIATAGGGTRRRAIGTGQELSEVIATPNSLGYGFWSVANFKGYTSTGAPNAKYLQVDGVDPLQSSYTGGTVPTSTGEIANVTLANVANGSYPIWSNLRLVNIGATASTAVTQLAAAAQTFVTGTSTPDFVPASSLGVVRSHFIPPAGSGEPTTAANGTGGTRACSASEVGGDVGGAVFTVIGDRDFCKDFSLTGGETGRRR